VLGKNIFIGVGGLYFLGLFFISVFSDCFNLSFGLNFIRLNAIVTKNTTIKPIITVAQPIFKVCKKQPSPLGFIGLIGWPQLGQDWALLEIRLLHSGQLTNIVLLFFINLKFHFHMIY
jgi:hypothetical protein